MTTLRGCFVTGTDTEVGKTRVSAGLLYWFGQRGLRSAGLKPVAAGTQVIDGAAVNDDVRILRDAGSLAVSDADVGPCQLAEPCAPYIAAALEGRPIDRQALHQAALALSARSDMLVVEGVGGFCVPLGHGWDSADLACDLGLPVILVVGLRLGCLNHALLTAEAVRSRGLRLAGWMGNTVDPQMRWRDENVGALHHEFARRHQVPCLGVLPWLENPGPADAARHFDADALRKAFALAPFDLQQPYRREAS